MDALIAYVDAAAYSAECHKRQRRRNKAADPYINHPLTVARMLAVEGGVTDPAILTAAALHDVIEDTDVTYAEILTRFGRRVADMVLDVTDDKALPKVRRKELQILNAPGKSVGAALIKLADKTCNLRDMTNEPPAGWSHEQLLAYFDHAQAVVAGLPRVNDDLMEAFEAAHARGLARLKDADRDDQTTTRRLAPCP